MSALLSKIAPTPFGVTSVLVLLDTLLMAPSVWILMSVHSISICARFLSENVITLLEVIYALIVPMVTSTMDLILAKILPSLLVPVQMAFVTVVTSIVLRANLDILVSTATTRAHAKMARAMMV